MAELLRNWLLSARTACLCFELVQANDESGIDAPRHERLSVWGVVWQAAEREANARRGRALTVHCDPRVNEIWRDGGCSAWSFHAASLALRSLAQGSVHDPRQPYLSRQVCCSIRCNPLVRPSRCAEYYSRRCDL